MKLLNDEDKMPLGKYRGEKMIDVPASYYNWFWHNGGKFVCKNDPVANYILRNKSALELENKDLIW